MLVSTGNSNHSHALLQPRPLNYSHAHLQPRPLFYSYAHLQPRRLTSSHAHLQSCPLIYSRAHSPKATPTYSHAHSPTATPTFMEPYARLMGTVILTGLVGWLGHFVEVVEMVGHVPTPLIELSLGHGVALYRLNCV